MFPYRRIVFPVDFSPGNVAIAPFVQEMTQRFQANLQLVRACAPEVFYAAEFGWQIAAASPTAQDLVETETQRLKAFAAEHLPQVQPEFICQTGHAIGVIEDVVRRNSADLIMLPTHGRGLFRRLLLGSITARPRFNPAVATTPAPKSSGFTSATGTQSGRPGCHTNVAGPNNPCRANPPSSASSASKGSPVVETYIHVMRSHSSGSSPPQQLPPHQTLTRRVSAGLAFYCFYEKSCNL